MLHLQHTAGTASDKMNPQEAANKSIALL